MNPSSSASSAGGDSLTSHLVELTSNTLQVVRVEAGAVGLSRNAALDNKAILELLLNDAAADWQTAGWTAGVGGFVPAASWHLVSEEQVRAVGPNATLGAVAGSLPHGFSGDLVVAGCSAAKGAPVEVAGENRWLLAIAPKEGLDKLLTGAERGKLTPRPIGPGVLDHIGAITRLLRVTGQNAVALWELGLERSHLFLVTANGVEAVVPCEIKLTDVWETIRSELNLKYQLAAARLFYGDLFDFTDAAPRVAGALAPTLSNALAALPSHGEKPALACAGLTGTQNWLVNHLAAAIGTTNWQPDPETALSEFGLHVSGDILPGQLAPATFGLLHRAAVNAKGGNAWKPVWHPASAAEFKIALPAASKPVAAPAPAPAPKPVIPAPALAPKPAPIPTPIPAPKPALKTPTPVPCPAQPTPTPVPAKPAQPAPAAKAPIPAPQPAKAPIPQLAKPATPAPAPAKPSQPAPQPTIKAPAAKTPAPQPVKPTEPPKPTPAPAARTPVSQPTKPSESPKPAPAAAPKAATVEPAAKKKAPVALIAIVAIVAVVGIGGFLFMQQSKAAAKERAAIEAKAKADADAAAKREAARQEELKKAQAEATRLKAEAERQAQIAAENARKQADALAAAKAAQEALASAPGVISITSDPVGAEVNIDGGTPQITPATITNVAPGLRKVTITLLGYDPVEQLVEVKGAQTLDLGSIALQRVYGTLMLRTEPADAEYAVFAADNVDGPALRTGRTPGSVDKLLPGEYVIKFTRQGLVPTTEHASITGKEIVDVNSAFIVGGVSLSSNPSGAAVRMNGEYLGVTPIVRPELQPGQATFEFTLPNHEPIKLAGEVANNNTLRLHAEMLHVDRIAKPSEVKSAPKILQTASPSIPAALGEVKGEVIISVVVTKLGTIRDIRVDKSDNPALTEPCLKAVKLWKFGPAISKSGQPVNMRISVPFKIDVKPQVEPPDDQINLPFHMRN